MPGFDGTGPGGQGPLTGGGRGYCVVAAPDARRRLPFRGFAGLAGRPIGGFARFAGKPRLGLGLRRGRRGRGRW
jgi:hypothetical protein